jgi:membrane protease YdiL (CAAX protease family)
VGNRYPVLRSPGKPATSGTSSSVRVSSTAASPRRQRSLTVSSRLDRCRTTGKRRASALHRVLAVPVLDRGVGRFGPGRVGDALLGVVQDLRGRGFPILVTALHGALLGQRLGAGRDVIVRILGSHAQRYPAAPRRNPRPHSRRMSDVPRMSAAARLLAAALVCAAAVPLYVFLHRPVGYALLVAGVALAVLVDRHLARHLALIAGGLVVISTMSLRADLTDAGMTRFAVVLSAAVLLPYLVQRYVYREDVIRFPWRTGQRWSHFEYGYLGVVLVLGYLLLPVYFIGSGSYRNWPTVTEPAEIARLFVGVNAVGLWDELFFICTVFALLRRHFSMWTANLLQAVVFVSFLWELGYQSWGPALTVPFAVLQGYIFQRTRSLAYVVTVHLSFDLIIFMILVHAHTPALFDVFVTEPAVP